jgi:hypothetical protein
MTANIIFSQKFREDNGVSGWSQRGFSSPAPHFVKMRVLKRWGGSNTWIETGTFLGHTSKALSEFAAHVYTIEPDPELYDQAKKSLKQFKNVTTIHGLSEEKLDTLIGNLSQEEMKDVSFWLDGHFSSGITFQGPIDTPIVLELGLIAERLTTLGNITVFVDDIRCFDPDNPEYSTYPDLNFLVNWANKSHLFWTIELDIFIATNRVPRPYLDKE